MDVQTPHTHWSVSAGWCADVRAGITEHVIHENRAYGRSNGRTQQILTNVGAENDG